MKDMLCPACNGELIGVEVQGRYDGISHWECKECKVKLSRIGYKKLNHDELCRYGKIYKVKGVAPYTYRIIEEREDI